MKVRFISLDFLRKNKALNTSHASLALLYVFVALKIMHDLLCVRCRTESTTAKVHSYMDEHGSFRRIKWTLWVSCYTFGLFCWHGLRISQDESVNRVRFYQGIQSIKGQCLNSRLEKETRHFHLNSTSIPLRINFSLWYGVSVLTLYAKRFDLAIIVIYRAVMLFFSKSVWNRSHHIAFIMHSILIYRLIDISYLVF